MSLATGVNLADIGAVIDAIAVEALAQNWTIDLDTPGGAGTRELYFSKAAADTFNGEDMSFGLWWNTTAQMDISGTWATFAFWTNAGVDLISNNFNAGSMTNPSAIYRNSTTGFWETTVREMDVGGNYIRHWIFGPVDTALISPVDHQYLYFVVETITGAFRSFYFGEIIKDDTEVWTGGQFFEGNNFNGIGGRDVRPFAGGFVHNIFAQNRGLGGMAVRSSNGFLVTPGNNEFAAHGSIGGTNNIEHPYFGAGMGRRNVGEDHFERSNAPFSGLAQRWPAEWFIENNHPAARVTENNMVPLGRVPDFFHPNIANFTPGDVIVDDTENFLVVPVTSKGGANNTGDEGFLIRNPLL
jgi:hypothetical protein